MEEDSYILADKVYFIESLPDGDKSTVEDLRDSILYERTKPEWFSISTSLVESKEELLDCLSQIKNDIKSSDTFPLIHLELHGYKEKKGAVLKNKDFVSWERIVNELQAINILSRLNLIVFLGACFSLSSIEFVVPNGRAPFFLLVASNKEIYAYQLSKIYGSFYKHLFQTKSVDKAIDAIKTISTQNSYDNISYITAAAYYNLFIKGYYEKAKDPNFRKKRIIEIVDRFKNEKSGLVDDELLRMWVALNIDNKEDEFFKNMNEKFFMKDLYKENIKRFPI